MGTETEECLGARVARIEGTVDQLDKRLASFETNINKRFNTLEAQITEQRRWIMTVIAAGNLAVILTIGILQLVLFL